MIFRTNLLISERLSTSAKFQEIQDEWKGCIMLMASSHCQCQCSELCW